MMVPSLVPRLMPMLMLHLLLAAAPPVEAVPYEPFDVAFDPSLFVWVNATIKPPTSGGNPVRTILLNLPASRRLTFLFNASSESPCTLAKKGIRVVDVSAGDTIATSDRRTVYLGPLDDLGSLRISAPEGTRYRVMAFALVMVQPAQPCVSSGDRCPALWAISRGLEVHSGIF